MKKMHSVSRSIRSILSNANRAMFSRCAARRETTRLFAALVIAAAIAAQPAAAANFNFDNPAGGDWTVDGNWDIAGEPDDAGDTAALGDLSGAYTTTLGVDRTIGGLTISGTDPTLDLASTLTIDGGNSTISGGLLTGSGILRLTGAASVVWSGSAPGGSLTIEVPFEKDNSPTIDNTGGGFGIASGQTFRWIGRDGSAGAGETVTFTDGFSNAGLFQIGQQQPGAHFANMSVVVTSGTLTNLSAGEIELNPREPNNLAAPWNNRFLKASLDNQGTVTVKTPAGQLGDAGKTVSNSGTITLDNSIIAGGSQDGRVTLNVLGDNFDNSGTVNVADNTLSIQTTSVDNTGDINVSTGVLSVVTDTFTLGASGNLNFTGEATLAFGANGVDTVVDWTGPDITGPLTFRVNRNAEITVNRTSAWDILSGQTLQFQVGGGSSETSLTTDQDVTNSGLILMGQDQPGDNFMNHRMTINSANSRLTNNLDGVITMFPRSDSSFFDPWSIRRLEAELINDGQFNVLTHRGMLGKAGVDHVNNGTLTLDDSILGPTAETPTLAVTGNSLTNAAGGLIQGDGVLDVSATTFNNAGTISPGDSAGLLQIDGDLNLQSGGTLLIEVTGAGATAGVDFDRLDVTGNINGIGLADLQVIIDPELFADIQGQTLRIILAGNDLSGLTFNNVVFGNQIRADVITGNGFVDLANFRVPEPNSGATMALAALGWLGTRRRRSGRNA